MNNKCVSLRSRTGDHVADVPLGQFIDDFKQEIENKVTEPSLVPVRKEN